MKRARVWGVGRVKGFGSTVNGLWSFGLIWFKVILVNLVMDCIANLG